jgi:hypothetical protein
MKACDESCIARITDAYHFLKHGATDDQQETTKQDCGSNEPSRPRGKRREQKAARKEEAARTAAGVKSKEEDKK